MLVYSVYAHMAYEYTNLIGLYDNQSAAESHAEHAKKTRPFHDYEDIIITVIEVKSSFELGE